MGESFITRRDSVNVLGSSDYFAAIDVTYPQGSICTCSNGVITLKAGDTTGKWMFSVPTAGTWAIEAALDEQWGYSSVIIDTEGQRASTSIGFSLVLFDQGTDNTSYTGGWSGWNSTTYPDALHLSTGTTTSEGSSGLIQTNNLINLEPYNNLHFRVTRADKVASTGSGVANGTQTLGISTGSGYVVSKEAGVSSDVRINISSYDSSYYIRISQWITSLDGSWSQGDLTVTKVWVD